MKKAKQKTYSTYEAAELTGLSVTTILNYVKDGKVDGLVNKINRRVKVTQKGLDQMLNRLEKNA